LLVTDAAHRKEVWRQTTTHAAISEKRKGEEIFRRKKA